VIELRGPRVLLRPQVPEDLPVLNEIVRAPGVAEIWGPNPEMDDQDAFTIFVDSEIAGWLGWYEESDEMYRHAGLDIFLAPRFQDRGLGREALRLGARWLIEERGHHRLIIDPAAHNARAIATYAAIGFKPVGVMRKYELGPDGEWHDGLLMDLLAEELIPT
jgi:aminoglycoside 6'-N-acetyltransferase